MSASTNARVSHRGQTSLPADLRRRWGIDQRGEIGSIDLGDAALIVSGGISVELERIDALELLRMTLAHLNGAEARGEVSPRLPLLMALRDKLAFALREES